MTLAASVAPLLTHFVPIVFLVHMLTDMLSRGRRRTEYLLVSGIVACVMSMFLEEFVPALSPPGVQPHPGVLLVRHFGHHDRRARPAPVRPAHAL